MTTPPATIATIHHPRRARRDRCARRSDRLGRGDRGEGCGFAISRRSDGFGRLMELRAVEVCVEAAAVEELVVGALFDDLTLVEDEDSIGIDDRRQPVSDHE